MGHSLPVTQGRDTGDTDAVSSKATVVMSGGARGTWMDTAFPSVSSWKQPAPRPCPPCVQPRGLVVLRVIGFLRGRLGPPFPSWLGLTLRTQGPPRTGTHTRPSSVTSTGSGVSGTSVIPGEMISPWWVPLQNRDTVSRRGGSHSDGGWRDPGSRLLPVGPSLREGSSGR